MAGVMMRHQPNDHGTGARPRILFLCQTLPYPPDGGVEIRSYNVARLLAREFDVTALLFYRRATRPTADDVANGVDGMRAFSDAAAFPIPQEYSRLRLLWDHFRSVAGGTVYTRYAYESSEFGAQLDAILAQQDFDLVHMDSLDLAAYLPRLGGIPVVCTHHNVESDLLRRRADAASFPLDHYLRLQASLMAREERRFCPQMHLNVAVSEEDASRFRQIVPNASFTVIPNGVDTSEFRPEAADMNGLVFVGGHGWYPNQDAMAYFTESILPVLRQDIPEVSLTWVGRAPDDVAESYARRHRIRLTGYVDDIRPFVRDAACYVVPLRIGGGSRLKILYAWAMGKAVVSTSIGCEGLDARDGENIIIRDDPVEFAAAIEEILVNPTLRDHIGRNARETAERVYDWDVLGGQLTAQYRALLP